ncbi:FAST kinase domain-containing protein 4 [Bombyx mandarina]|uniref:FAST kinase domain-containing protein 4 n=1 Tax=Bombyx mandarina TaxID=7092 RepID=A0A6J2JAB6_BOMMA|nr:FAST kinase domain-containing protein 4 [Bombyx mandarina]XP_028026244.1 FAST kinase domain-containing protein 4 [Bombyx mandarina]
MLRFSGSISWRLGIRAIIRKQSTTNAAAVKTDKIEDTKNVQGKIPIAETFKDTSGLVAAAFAHLNSESEITTTKKPSPKSAKISRHQQLENQISKAADVNSLLLVAENPVVSRRHALKMVSILSEWSSTNKVNLNEFEKDPRFLKLCRILARTSTTHAMSSLTMAEDLSTVLGITGDDEAARLISNLTLSQMIKVMKALQQKGRRSTPLLRALSHNITSQAEVIDLKKSADLLFSMASLNFPDPLLLDRICNDVIDSLPKNEDKPAVVNSIIVSLGLMKYRHEPALSAITEWMMDHSSVCRTSDVASAVVTLATLNYVPPGSEALFEMARSLKEEEVVKPSTWLDLVFSLLILDKADHHHLVSTLRPEFIDKLLTTGDIPIPCRRKLMMIDAYIQLTRQSSVLLPDDVREGVPLVYNKEKALFIHAVLETFRSLVSSTNFLKKDCNSNMGFLYDAEFAVDAKCHPVPLDKAAGDKSVYRIAVMALDYHDMSRRTIAPLGTSELGARLLRLKGYRVIQIHYTDFDPKDKLVTRVQYIEKLLKEAVNNKNN